MIVVKHIFSAAGVVLKCSWADAESDLFLSSNLLVDKSEENVPLGINKALPYNPGKMTLFQGVTKAVNPIAKTHNCRHISLLIPQEALLRYNEPGPKPRLNLYSLDPRLQKFRNPWAMTA